MKDQKIRIQAYELPVTLHKEEGMKIPLKLKASSQKESNIFSLNFPLIISST